MFIRKVFSFAPRYNTYELDDKDDLLSDFTKYFICAKRIKQILGKKPAKIEVFFTDKPNPKYKEIWLKNGSKDIYYSFRETKRPRGLFFYALANLFCKECKTDISKVTKFYFDIKEVE